MDWHWYNGSENWKDVFLIPIEEISFNTSTLGNHPSTEAIIKFLDEVGKENYKHWHKRDYTEGRQPDGTWIVWEGHQIGQRWRENKDDEEAHAVFRTFDELFEYVRKEGIYMHPVRVILEPDGELFLMEGRHRYMAARILGMTEIPCIIQVRSHTYESKPIRTFQRIR